MNFDVVNLPRSVLELALEALSSARVWKSKGLHELTVPKIQNAVFSLRSVLDSQDKLNCPCGATSIDQVNECAYENCAANLPDALRLAGLLEDQAG